MVDIGDSGRNSDGGVSLSCNIGIVINENKLNFPNPEQIWNNQINYPYVFVGDKTFPSFLRINLMKPYPREIRYKRNEYSFIDCQDGDV